MEEDDVLDEEGRARLKLKVHVTVVMVTGACPYDLGMVSYLQVENTIRWRNSTDESGNVVRESNTRIVRWSDGR